MKERKMTIERSVWMRKFNFSSDILNKVLGDELSPYLIFCYTKDGAPAAILGDDGEKIILICKDEEFENLRRDGILRRCAENLLAAGYRIDKEPAEWHPVTWDRLYHWQERKGFRYAYPHDISATTAVVGISYSISDRYWR